jgi:Mg-chelatase subunit ChlD
MRLYLLLLLYAIPFLSQAQLGYSSGSVSMNRAYGIYPSRAVVVEEFMNYHLHNIPLPGKGSNVALDLRWGNQKNVLGSEAILQVGIATNKLNQNYTAPVNLSVVLDISGSMAGERLDRSKEAVIAMLKKLRPSDRLSIITYHTRAEILLPSQLVGNDTAKIRQLVSGLQVLGSTNLHGGMMLGFIENQKFFDPKATNRVLLMTDGNANEGVTDPAQIAKDAAGYNAKGIGISTIGLGNNVQFDLLRSLAGAGRGQHHFVDDGDDIKKVFIQEVESLISPIARDPKLLIEYSPDLQLQNVYGYAPVLGKGTIAIDLDNFNSGLTQVILARFATGGNEAGYVKVSLSYFDLQKNKMEVIELQSALQTAPGPVPVLIDKEVKKNFSIACMATSLKEALADLEKHKDPTNLKPVTILKDCLAAIDQLYPSGLDQDQQKIREILDRQVLLLQKMAQP